LLTPASLPPPDNLRTQRSGASAWPRRRGRPHNFSTCEGHIGRHSGRAANRLSGMRRGCDLRGFRGCEMDYQERLCKNRRELQFWKVASGRAAFVFGRIEIIPVRPAGNTQCPPFVTFLLIVRGRWRGRRAQGTFPAHPDARRAASNPGDRRQFHACHFRLTPDGSVRAPARKPSYLGFARGGAWPRGCPSCKTLPFPAGTGVRVAMGMDRPGGGENALEFPLRKVPRTRFQTRRRIHQFHRGVKTG